MEKQLESVTIELPEIGQTCGFAIGEPRASFFDFTIFLGQLRFELFSLGLAILDAW